MIESCVIWQEFGHLYQHWQVEKHGCITRFLIILGLFLSWSWMQLSLLLLQLYWRFKHPRWRICLFFFISFLFPITVEKLTFGYLLKDLSTFMFVFECLEHVWLRLKSLVTCKFTCNFINGSKYLPLLLGEYYSLWFRTHSRSHLWIIHCLVTHSLNCRLLGTSLQMNWQMLYVMDIFVVQMGGSATHIIMGAGKIARISS